ncbi:hypothetical protein NQ315_004020 [Exocentrus adspersus]|uniref:PiggyBac transposable element-derived protein domain-containing protein n=1 Tax=Exocentrus adspersus TaxID=1586481 RepID=A0AAV8V795_9CUCU|nr:hypothetical protein NQ315_004020 [Exocentrus adspersus]
MKIRGDEDEGGVADNLNPRQLSAGVEIVFANSERLGDFQTDPLETSTDNLIGQNLATTTCRQQDFPTGDYAKYSSMSCVELLELFLTTDFFNKIISETRVYALFKNDSDPNLTVPDLKVFISILLLSGYNQLPSKRSYWENSSDMKNILVSEAMRRDRFLQICRLIHFADNNNIDKNDKMYKLRPITDMLKKSFLEHFIPEQNLAYDESMIRYFGHHSCKQFIRGKPVRFRYKVWCLNTPSGYLINFEVYQGKNPRSNQEYEGYFGKATAPLVQMIEELGEKRLFRYNFFVDNLFTSKNLMSTLKTNGYGTTGTIRENRIPRTCPLVTKKTMEKRERGDYLSTLDKEIGILYVRWKDNKVVTIGSTCFGVEPIRNVDRFSKKESKTVAVPRPYLISQYNKSMGGTDQMDNNISCYRIGIRKKSRKNISQLEFRRNICQVLSIANIGISDAMNLDITVIV